MKTQKEMRFFIMKYFEMMKSIDYLMKKFLQILKDTKLPLLILRFPLNLGGLRGSFSLVMKTEL
jgi:hypothetical protein